MNNKDFAKLFSELADLMELQKENPFKIKSYRNAYISLRKIDTPLAELSEEQLAEMPGIGKTIAAKIREIVTTGKLATLEKYRAMVPEGVRELLRVHGLGPRKVDAIWKQLNVSSPGELLYACNENRLIELPGFGEKTQQDVRKKLEFYFSSSGKYLYAKVAERLQPVVDQLNEKHPELKLQFTGQMRRKCQIIDKIELICHDFSDLNAVLMPLGEISSTSGETLLIDNEDFVQMEIFVVSNPDQFGSALFRTTGPQEFVEKYHELNSNEQYFKTENDLFARFNKPWYPPVLRDNDLANEEFLTSGKVPDLIDYQDIVGIIHNHSDWSDGIHSLPEMADFVHQNGFGYFVISDHSKSAFYANGLSEERVVAQWQEIDKLNASYTDFKVFKSIEADILSEGQLDYPDELLSGFDLVIASVHSNLNMDQDKAMKRLIKAVENPYTRILGHPTGRLLLARSGYPVDHMKLIDACAANNVVIELNANPLRLDLDWSWIPYAMNKSVMIAINPDAHNKSGIFDIRYGVFAAQKGGLTKEACLNTMHRDEFETWLASK